LFINFFSKIHFGIHFAAKEVRFFVFYKLFEKGKPLERVGRKAAGLSSDISEYGSRVAEQP
jgi:hypothetical protein